jgi:cell pole-organizing protein PopZ
MDDLQSIADKSGKSLEEVVAETLRWSLKRFKEDPEFAASIRRGIEEHRDNQDEQ